jgi:hypothetical protein
MTDTLGVRWTIGVWLASADGVLMAEDVARWFGAFDDLCPPESVNSGILAEVVRAEHWDGCVAELTRRVVGAS